MQTQPLPAQSSSLSILYVYYSQTGQTKAALQLFADAADLGRQVQARYVCLDHEAALEVSFPWSLDSFIRMPAQVLLPVDPVSAAEQSVNVPLADTANLIAGADLIVLAYPVWFMCPALPMQRWLAAVGPQAFVGKPIVTLSTSRKMWLEAQRAVKCCVEAAGGRIITHIALCDRARNFASMASTVHFLLTGRPRFRTKLLAWVAPSFGIDTAVYRSFESWLREHSDQGPLSLPNHFDLDAGLALCELIGKPIMRFNYVPVRLAERWMGARVAKAIAYGAAFATVICILVLTPIVYLLGRILRLAGFLDASQLGITSTPRL